MISNKYNFSEFCKSVKLQNQLEIIDLICEEIHSIKLANKKRTGSPRLRDGSKQRAYCENLQKLLFIVMNVSLPDDLEPGFLQDIGPIIARLYQKNRLFKGILKIVAKDIGMRNSATKLRVDLQDVARNSAEPPKDSRPLSSEELLEQGKRGLLASVGPSPKATADAKRMCKELGIKR